MRGSSLTITKVATGFQFTEGPVWHPKGFLLFSDIPANTIWQLFPDGTKKIYLNNSGFSGGDRTLLSDQVGSNGLAIDHQENLVICQHGNHSVSVLDKHEGLTVLTGDFEGRRFNSPNDLVIKSDGSIYFSDPPYGLKDQLLQPHVFQPRGALYHYKNAKTQLISDDLRYPNGVCFSPDETYLYLSSNRSDEPYLFRYQLDGDGRIKDQSVLIEQNADGIKTDRKGNLYLSTNDGILIVTPAGKKMGLISLPETPANIAWRKPDYSGLYCTARSSVYLITGFN